MSEVAIREHDFEEAKNNIKVFLEQEQKEIGLNKVANNVGLFGKFDHKVTGYELNSLTSQIQEHFIDLNNSKNKLIKEFGEVYNAFDALDKEYIQAILLSFKSLEKTNEKLESAVEVQKKMIDVLNNFKIKIEGYKHLNELEKFWSDSQRLQKELDELLNSVINSAEITERNSQELKILYDFKSKVEELKHLVDIDELWSESQYLMKEMLSVSENINDVVSALEDQSQMLNTINEFKDNVENIKHLNEVDKLWDYSLQFSIEIDSIKKSIEVIIQENEKKSIDIDKLNSFMKKIEEYEHLNDIDMLWNRSENAIKDSVEFNEKFVKTNSKINEHEQSIGIFLQFKKKIDNLEHIEQVDQTWTISNKVSSELDSTKKVINEHACQIDGLEKQLQVIQNENNAYRQSTKKKLNVVSAIAASSLGVAVVELLLLLLR